MVNIVCALLCEAKSIIQRYQLKQIKKEPFSIYSNNEIFLVISGLRKTHAAAATAYLAAKTENQQKAWLNIGIAGHKKKEIGTPFLVNRILDNESNRSFYPTFVFDPPVSTASLVTSNNVEVNYPENTLYDMEGAAFFETALKFSISEMVHLFKVVSDNPKQPADEKVTPSFVEKLIERNCEKIVQTISSLQSLSNQLSTFYANSSLEPFTSLCHFTETQKIQLKSLVQRYQLLSNQELKLDEKCQSFKKGKDVLNYLEKQIEAQPMHIIKAKEVFRR